MLYYIASTYGQNSYNSTNYNGTTTSSSGTVAPPASVQSAAPSGSLLTNTGFEVALAVGLAGLLIVVAVIVRFWKRPAIDSAQ